MELKSYQEQAIHDLKSFLDFMNREDVVCIAKMAMYFNRLFILHHVNELLLSEADKNFADPLF